MLNDQLSNALATILNAERISKKECLLRGSKLIKQVLALLQANQYVGECVPVQTSRGELLSVKLIGSINKVGSVKPRFAVKSPDFEKFEKRFLPAKDFGILIVSTNKGLLTHKEAKETNTGGKLIAYCY